MILHFKVFVNVKRLRKNCIFLCFIKLVAHDDLKWSWVTFDLSNNYNMQPTVVYIYPSYLVILSIKIIILLKFTFLTFRDHLVQFQFIYHQHFKLLNIVIVVLKLTKIWHFDPILRHWLCLGQKQVTMETRNIKYDMIWWFLLIIC